METQIDILEQAKLIREEIDRIENEKVSVALFGHSGAGKSTIINKLTGKELAKVDVKTDTTTKKQNYEWEGIFLTDLPGYNTKKFPAEEYLEKFRILEDFDIFICVFEGKLSKENAEFFTLLKEHGKKCIFVRNKCDTIWDSNKTFEVLTEAIVKDLNNQIGSYGEEIIFTSGRDNFGFDKLQNAIFRSLNESKRSRWVTSTKAYSFEFLEKKKKEAERMVVLYAGLSAANGINPVPGLDVSIDVSALLSLFKKLRNTYGLTEESLSKYKLFSPSALHAANSILKLAGKQGVLLLLKRFASKTATKQISKYIPFVGPAVAASVGFAITKAAGSSYLEQCHEIAKEILEIELKKN
ncbi:50S ribosome-binding GTPase [Salegentibacter sp. BDJ18]|uniref:GTPase n=1 Tax=Salegentibacter sp. BDJ18 TaxID=2816376 RepID=UPI001AAEDEA5|nr:GTPase [Salegentibacter sp. BDJ18]MBO2546023.1 50S ribosome-binding GTPase [Salegentibacter sp. BDJ18]